MTTLTIIKDDNGVAVDGTFRSVDCSNLASNVHAIQFDGSNGYIEYNDGTPNEAITDVDAYQSYIDAWTAAAPVEQTEEERFASLSYTEKRAETYLEFGDQLDQQYWDSVNDTTTWVDGIAAVKALYPKE